MSTVYEMCQAQDDAGDEVWHDCASLSVENVVRMRSGDGLDTLTFDIANGTALTDGLTFAYKSYVRLRRTVDGGSPELLFFGRVTTVPRHAAGSDIDRQAYTVSGPGEQLAATIYRQDWVEQTGVVTKPRVILFQSSAGARCTTGAQIFDAVYWGYSCGVKIAEPSAENILTGVALPYDERINIKCLDAVIECLRWHPHAVVWWDYSQRLPVFHCALRASLSSASVAMSDLPSDIAVDERRDLQIPAVCICYEKSVQVDESSWKNTVFDVAPTVEGETPSELAERLNRPDVVWACYDLEGYSQSNVEQKIVVEAFPSDYLSKSWWKARESWLQEYSDSNITLSDGGRAGDSELTNILIEGQPQPWMNKSVENERVFVTAEITKVEDEQVVVVERRLITRVVQATNCLSKTYKTTQAVNSGESVPEGVAAAFYAEWSGLHCEGSFVIDRAECPCSYSIGQKLNITGGRSEWASMAAMICRVTERFDDGSTTVEFGPIRTIDVDTLVSLFRATRNRQFSFSRIFRGGAPESEGESGSGSPGLAVNPSFSGLSTTMRMCLMASNGTATHKVDIDPASIESAPSTPENTPQTLKIRPIEIVENDGPDSEGQGRVAVFKAYCIVTDPVFDRYEATTNVEAGGGVEFTLADPLVWSGAGADVLSLQLAPSSGLAVVYTGETLVGLSVDVGDHSGLQVNTDSPSKGLHLRGLTPDTAPTAAFVWGYDGTNYGKFSVVQVSLT